VSFQIIDPRLGAVTTGVVVAHLSTMVIGAEVQGQFLRIVDVAACMTRTWRELGTVDLGAKLWN
jgi:hypothetical protein